MILSKLSDRIKEKTKNSFGPEDPDWYQYILDHKLYLREQSEVKSFTLLDLVKYRYRPEEFFVSMDGDLNQAWIFMLVNDIRSPTDFTEALTKLWIVKPEIIEDLRRRYESTAQFQAKPSS